MNIRIETPRLIIRELLPTDEEAMFAMDSDPEVHRYLGNMPYTDIAQSRDNIEFVRQQYLDNGIGRWAVTLKDTSEFIGWTGYKLMREMVNGHVNHYDFGYRHLRKFWGQGYAHEAAKAALDYGIDVLGFRDIYGMTDVNNKGSRRILEKLGFRLIEIFPYDGAPTWRKPCEFATWYKLIDNRVLVLKAQIASAAQRLQWLCDTIPPLLSAIDKAAFAAKPAPNKWSPKEILGHLIDSATNNHHRLVRGQFEDAPRIVYDPDEWNLHGYYQSLDGNRLIQFWDQYNRHLLALLQRLPERMLARTVRSGNEGETRTIAFLINDYVAHLEHHLRQMVTY